MQERTILLHFSAVPLRQKLVAGAVAVAIGSGLFAWSRHGAPPQATSALLSFDAGTGTQAEPGGMNANAKEPAVALARSILSDEAVAGLTKQARVPLTDSTSDAGEFRSRLDMVQTSTGLLRVSYRDPDTRISAAVANAVANMLVAWIPAPFVATATSAPGPSGRRRHSSHLRSRPLRELENQLVITDRKLAALYAGPIAPQKSDAAAPNSSTDNERRRMLESQLGLAQKKLDDLRTRYTDEYPDVQKAKEDLAEIHRKLASLPQGSNEGARVVSPPKLDGDANGLGELRLERARLTVAIVAEKRREGEQRDHTVSSARQSALAAKAISTRSPQQTPVRPSLSPVGEQIWQRPFTLVRLAGDSGADQSERGLWWYWPLAGILCGLLYLGGAILRYRPIERAAPLEPPVLNNKLSAEKAPEHAEDRWAKEVLKSLSLTGIGHEDEAFAGRPKPFTGDNQPQTGLQVRADYDEVLAAVRENIKKNPGIEETKLANAARRKA
jgi:hypothetical protein